MFKLKPEHARKRGRIPRWLWFFFASLLLVVLAILASNIPFVHDRLSWRLTVLQAEIKYALFPPEEAIFTPGASENNTQLAATPTPSPQPSLTPAPTEPPELFSTPSQTPTSLPETVMLGGVVHEYQKYNNCGPANLSMALSFWGWKGDQRDTAAVMKPNPEDKNVMPYEMEDFVESHTSLRAIVRVGGDLELIKSMVAAGFPTLIEIGYEPPDKDWMGHYELITGYDDTLGRLIVQDTYIMADFPIPYEEVITYWRHFNSIYIVLYPPESEAWVMELLGPHADEIANYQYAAQIASDEIVTRSGRDLYFAWFNRGTNLMYLQDYAGAAEAYDQAFQIYATLDPAIRPWRMLWYQTGPYFAYYFSGRYYDVINLADNVLTNMDKPIHEESFYWRALAKEALGDVEGAIADLRSSLQVHPDFEPSLQQLERLGVSP